MSDAGIAMIARGLAVALSQAAYSRAPDDWKQVMQRQHELCAYVRAEKEEAKEKAP
jgi:hypothetical protein